MAAVTFLSIHVGFNYLNRLENLEVLSITCVVDRKN